MINIKARRKILSKEQPQSKKESESKSGWLPQTGVNSTS